MDVWDKITGNDLTREWREFEARASRLPREFRDAWGEVIAHLFPYGNFSGRNLTPIVDGVLGLLEASAAEGQSVRDALGDDIPGFAAAVAGGEGAQTYRDRWRVQLNKTVAKKLGEGV